VRIHAPKKPGVVVSTLSDDRGEGRAAMLHAMARSTGAAAKIQATALRALADEVEAGRRRLSPQLSRVLASAIDAAAIENLSPRAWADAWGVEIDRRMAKVKAGTAKRQDLGAVLERLRARR
jgi:hypothetical protein